jgi:hypothetical protein
MAEINPTTENQEIKDMREIIEKVKCTFTRIAGVAHLAEESISDGGYDSELKPWNKEAMLKGAFSQIFKEAGEGWNLLFEDFDHLFSSIECPKQAQENLGG